MLQGCSGWGEGQTPLFTALPSLRYEHGSCDEQEHSDPSVKESGGVPVGQVARQAWGGQHLSGSSSATSSCMNLGELFNNLDCLIRETL